MKLFPGILAITLFAAATQAQTPSPQKSTPKPTPKRAPLIYKIPGHAVAGVRRDIDAGSRGWTPNMPSLYVLAPNHTGFTTRAQPELFWYQSGPAGMRIEVTVIEPGKPKPVLRVGADKADQPGIHRLLLARYNINLAPGVLYKWTVALVPDPANRSQDVIASDTIQRAEPGAQFTSALADAEGLDKAALYARQGIWYDALEAVSHEIDAAPKDKELRFQRAALLEQAGLKKAAAFERQ
jgi:hypothetical protein